MTIRNEKLIGRLTDHPTLKTHGETTFCEFTVAMNYEEKGEKKVRYFKTSFVNKYGKLAHKNLQKGDRVVLLGGFTDLQIWQDNKGLTQVTELLKYPESFIKSAHIEGLDDNE